ncbi:hypothetical protein AB0D14_35555 [Streptomyces sp. NPDC048484]|uniref:hypothetical protein n=1 Tax=Streptomyces sp. NPDC048484 TaxID=3155146 RepID=UPI003433841C
MKVEIQPDVRDTAARLGADVPYVLKALAGQLADDPDMGRPLRLPGISRRNSNRWGRALGWVTHCRR